MVVVRNKSGEPAKASGGCASAPRRVLAGARRYNRRKHALSSGSAVKFGINQLVAQRAVQDKITTAVVLETSALLTMSTLVGAGSPHLQRVLCPQIDPFECAQMRRATRRLALSRDPTPSSKAKGDAKSTPRSTPKVYVEHESIQDSVAALMPDLARDERLMVWHDATATWSGSVREDYQRMLQVAGESDLERITFCLTVSTRDRCASLFGGTRAMVLWEAAALARDAGFEAEAVADVPYNNNGANMLFACFHLRLGDGVVRAGLRASAVDASAEQGCAVEVLWNNGWYGARIRRRGAGYVVRYDVDGSTTHLGRFPDRGTLRRPPDLSQQRG